MSATSGLESYTFSDFSIGDEPAFSHIGLYSELKQTLQRGDLRFRVMPKAYEGRWDRTLLLNLTFWGGGGTAGDVLEFPHLEAWHYLAAKHLAQHETSALSADALFLGEAIASAFDIYLLGRMIDRGLESSFLDTTVPAMAETAEAAGVDERRFQKLLEDVALDPERAFEDLRQLLFDATTALLNASGVEHAFSVLQGFDHHRFACLLHRYELSNWVLYARAYCPNDLAPEPRVRAVDAELRKAPTSLAWLRTNWMGP